MNWLGLHKETLSSVTPQSHRSKNMQAPHAACRHNTTVDRPQISVCWLEKHDCQAEMREGGLPNSAGAAADASPPVCAALLQCHPLTDHTHLCVVQARGLSSSCSSNSTKTAIQQRLHACSQPNTTTSTGWGLMRAAKQQFKQCRAFSAAAGGPTKQPAAARSAPGPRATPEATAAGRGGTAGAAAAGAPPAPQLSPFEKWWRNFQRVPPAPKWLGIAGAIPFIALAPPVCKHLAPLLPTSISENCDMVQVGGWVGGRGTLPARTHARTHAGQQL